VIHSNQPYHYPYSPYAYIHPSSLYALTKSNPPPQGNYLSTPSPSFPDTHTQTLTYFPSSSLPLDPPTRFSDLFLTRPKWLAADIAPFLIDCAVDKKERDKLLLKYARAMTEGTGKEIYYTARGKM
jgi:sister chromatid cohesion protein DCC1